MNAEKKIDRRVKYTKQAIRDGFLKLLSIKPIEKISVTEICREADINRGTFYAHYKCPEDLKNSLEQELTQAIYERRRELGATGRLTSLQTLELLKEKEELCKIFAGPYGDREAMFRLVRSHADAYLEQAPAFFYELSAPLQTYLEELLVSSITTVVKQWFDTGMEESPDKVAHLIDTYCAHGIYGFSPSLHHLK